MPATMSTDTGESVDEIPIDSPETTIEGLNPDIGVTAYLDLALQAAREQDMNASELMGLLFYYAHSIAEGYRQDVVAEEHAMREQSAT